MKAPSPLADHWDGWNPSAPPLPALALLTEWCNTIAPFLRQVVFLGANTEPHSTSRPSSRSRLFAFCTPELWIEGQRAYLLLRLTTGAVRQYVVQISVIALAYFFARKRGQATASIRGSNLGRQECRLELWWQIGTQRFWIE